MHSFELKRIRQAKKKEVQRKISVEKISFEEIELEKEIFLEGKLAKKYFQDGRTRYISLHSQDFHLSNIGTFKNDNGKVKFRELIEYIDAAIIYHKEEEFYKSIRRELDIYCFIQKNEPIRQFEFEVIKKYYSSTKDAADYSEEFENQFKRKCEISRIYDWVSSHKIKENYYYDLPFIGIDLFPSVKDQLTEIFVFLRWIKDYYPGLWNGSILYLQIIFEYEGLTLFPPRNQRGKTQGEALKIIAKKNNMNEKNVKQILVRYRYLKLTTKVHLPKLFEKYIRESKKYLQEQVEKLFSGLE